MKICAKCSLSKLKAEFHNSRSRVDKLYPWCKLCCKIYSAKYYKNNKTEILDQKSNLSYEQIRGYSLKARYGITYEEYEAKSIAQNRLCAICHKPEPYKGKSLATDHNHANKQIRDLLCSKCNQTLGLVNESPVILQTMMDYLKKWTVNV